MDTILKLGSRSDDVKTLQVRLNAILTPTPALRPDGSFGPLTRDAVLRFQRGSWLVEDGEVGPSTWNAAMGTETYSPILHPVPFICQPTSQTCWAASTAMLTRSSVPAVMHALPQT